MKTPRTVTAANAFRRAIDDFMAGLKTLDGEAEWVRGTGHDDVRAGWPIFRDGTSTGATLQVTAYPNERSGMRFTIGVHLDDCVWRLDHELMTEKHRNPLPQNILSGRHQVIAGPHVHAWVDNRQYVRAGRVLVLPFAVKYAGPRCANSRNWPATLRWACGETKIKMNKGQMLDWPERTKFI